MTAEVTCPICHAPIPLAKSDRPNSQGLSTGLDDRLVEEHIDMHKRCLCTWRNGSIFMLDVICPIHAYGEEFFQYGEPDNVFIEQVED